MAAQATDWVIVLAGALIVTTIGVQVIGGLIARPSPFAFHSSLDRVRGAAPSPRTATIGQ